MGELIMLKSLLAASVGLVLVSTPAFAATNNDPVGDFLPSYTGPHQADLDVKSFSVTYNGSTGFDISATMAGPIDLAAPGFYVVGVNTGGGTFPGTFAAIGQPQVIFNKVFFIRKVGNSTIDANILSPTFAGDTWSVFMPLTFLPAATNGFTPNQFGFNLWPRSGAGGSEVISDFGPDNANLTAVGLAPPVPEPASWAMLVAGFGAIGAMMRSRRQMMLRIA
jgi:hypothetical protein